MLPSRTARNPPLTKLAEKACCPAPLLHCANWRVVICPGDGQAFRGVRFVDDTTSVEANFSNASGFGVRRTVLHQKDGRKSARMWSHPAVEHTRRRPVWWWRYSWRQAREGEVDHRSDGIHSRVRRWAALNAKGQREIRYAQRQHFRVRAWTDYMGIHWGKKAQVYVTPLTNDETCVALISRDPRMRLQDAWKEFPRLAGHLRHAQPSSAERGCCDRDAQFASGLQGKYRIDRRRVRER